MHVDMLILFWQLYRFGLGWHRQGQAYQAMGKLKSNVEVSLLLVRMTIAVASSDGNFDAKNSG